jgi:ATP-dependent DNA ligase
MAPTNRAKPFNDPSWIWELKHDGYRALLIRNAERISLQNRKGNELLHFFPEIAVDLRKLPDIAIDGELVMLDEHGKPEFTSCAGGARYVTPGALGEPRLPSQPLSSRSTCCSFAARICARCHS